MLSLRTHLPNRLLAAIIALYFISTPGTLSTGATASDIPAIDAEFHQALLDLTNPWTVMCVAAHPDDEDGATLTVLRRKHGAHTVSLFSTFGEGGQNAIGPDLYEELGAIRARETLKASEIQGSDPYFLGLKDFGFSKSAEEAFRIWGHDEALRRMVLEIRKLRPDVIITNHDTTSGHGHHQATGRLVLEAFEAAANPRMFPDQLNVAGVWQVKRLFVRMGSNAGAPATTARIITIDRNELDPVRGSTYAEQALRALQQHASQGPWPKTVPAGGMPPIRYQLVREAKGTSVLPSNAKTFVDGLLATKTLSAQMDSLKLDGRPLVEFVGERSRVLDTLVRARKKGVFAESKNGSFNDVLMRQRFYAALQAASGLVLNITTSSNTLVPRASKAITVTVSNEGANEILLGSLFAGLRTRVGKPGQELKVPESLKPNSSISLGADFVTPAEAGLTVQNSAHLYDGRWRGEEVLALLSGEIKGAEFTIQRSIHLDVAPPVEIINISPSPYIFTPANLDSTLTFMVRLKNNEDQQFRGQFGIESPNDHINEVGAEINLAPNEDRAFVIQTNVIPVDTPDERRTPRNDFGPLIISVHPWESDAVLSKQEIPVIYSDARVPENLRVGYIRSFDDSLRNALSSLGVESREILAGEIHSVDLSKFHTIIIDNRGYQAHPELVTHNTRLLEFVKSGGTLIVFYHRVNEWNPDPSKNRPSLAPYPIMLGDGRVTDEKALVTFIEPQHPLLNVPNKLNPGDFNGWIQERGLYYPKTWDSNYQALFAANDPGEKPLRGGLLVAGYGRGHYIYTSMVWYRQLRAGIPGGLRMFANMISYGSDEIEK